jgi:hypothetical protein
MFVWLFWNKSSLLNRYSILKDKSVLAIHSSLLFPYKSFAALMKTASSAEKNQYHSSVALVWHISGRHLSRDCNK